MENDIVVESTERFKKVVLTSPQLVETLPVLSWPAENASDLKVSDYETLLTPMGGVYVENLPKITIILNPDGSIWMHGSLYLLSRALDYKSIEPEAIDSIARDLVAFRNTLLAHGLDYQVFPINLLKRPTYAYSSILNEKVKQKPSSSVEKRKLSSMRGFYRWMKRNDPSFRPEYPMWVDEVKYVSFEDSDGNTIWKEVITSDLSIKHAAQDDLESIDDGGKLRPLRPDELEQVLRALCEEGNTEMMLIFAIALTSGARIQTVLTLRLGDICTREHQPDRLIATKCGGGRRVKTKNNKALTIFIPYWVHKKLSIYVKSQRYLDRLSRSGYADNDESYVFLTSAAKPYYMARSDPNYALTPKTINGGAVRTFLSRLKRKMLIEHGQYVDFRFHDLRATFGMNLFNELMQQVNSGKRSLSSALNYLRKRMSHSSLETTMRYFRYYEDVDVAYEAQASFEKKIADLMHGAEQGIDRAA
ncbi:tyrosine-type recombinase/integrase [Pseudomonas sp. PB3P13]